MILDHVSDLEELSQECDIFLSIGKGEAMRKKEIALWTPGGASFRNY